MVKGSVNIARQVKQSKDVSDFGFNAVGRLLISDALLPRNRCVEYKEICVAALFIGESNSGR